jgi:hypothetical protein
MYMQIMVLNKVAHALTEHPKRQEQVLEVCCVRVQHAVSSANHIHTFLSQLYFWSICNDATDSLRQLRRERAVR